MRAMRYGIWMLAALCAPDALGKSLLTIRQAMETTRFMVADEQSRAIAVSPDGRRYVAALVRGDVARDGVEVEIMAGGLDSLEAAKPRSLARLFTRGLGGGPFGRESDGVMLLMGGANFPAWLDNERVALRWEDERGVQQVITMNARTHEVLPITRSVTNVTSFAASKTAAVFVAKQPWSLDKSDQMAHEGFVVTSTDAISLMLGVVDGTTAAGLSWGVGEHYVQAPHEGRSTPRRVAGLGDAMYWLPFPAIRPSVSPDERWAVVSGTPADTPPSWGRYPQRHMKMILAEWHANKLGIHARKLQQPFLIDLATAQARPLFDAPALPFSTGAEVRWAPGGRKLVLGPTFLPLDSTTEAGLQGYGFAVVDVSTGRVEPLPVSLQAAHQVQDNRWVSQDTIELKLPEAWTQFHRRQGQWLESGQSPVALSVSPVRVEIRQTLNTPPALYAIDSRTGAEAMVLDPNPGLREIALGEVRFVNWQDADGHRWEGRLYLPVDYVPAHRYPLVIQGRGFGGTRDEFSLYGGRGIRPTLGPGWSVLLAQPLAAQGIAVLQVGHAPDGSIANVQDEAWVMTRGYDAAVEHLDAAGIIDRDRVGLMGYSRGGWHAGYALAFGGHQYAAALTDDNIESGYIEAAMRAWTDPEMRNGGEPFGQGLKAWMENATAFNVEHIRAPLLMTLSDGFAGRAGVVAQGWELFSRLRRLNKPVEFYVVPDVVRGHHALQNPRQLLALQGRAMDWWRFWLKDETDADPGKQAQYEAWRRLRVLRDGVLAKPVEPRLQWTAEPVGICDIRHC